MKRLFLFAALAAAVVTASPARTVRADEPKAGEFFFKPGDRIVFLGDSITML
ncbi:unnamed protein product [Gemmataceae bacterium]|nr:unnamed protein product [Gemmataceae bacterium]VTT99081.1 unnamed protein product [Gemmataceae bacterium]